MGIIKKSMWFALLPVKTTNRGWVWLMWVTRIVDDFDVTCFGGTEHITYKI